MLQNAYTGPWHFLGDFNAVLGAHEKLGGRAPIQLSCQEFLDWTTLGDLSHIQTKGHLYTWSNGRRGCDHIRERLDRLVCNLDAGSFWNGISCCALPCAQSDHCPILVVLQKGAQSGPSPFRFFSMWLDHSGCRQVVEEIWRLEVGGCAMFVLRQKLKLLKFALRRWNKEVFGNVHVRVKEAWAKLGAVQLLLDERGPLDDLLSQEVEVQVELQQALNFEEAFWKEKARVKWNVNGDRNTAFFHRLVKGRSTSRPLQVLRVGERILESDAEIQDQVVDFFSALYGGDNVCQPNGLVQGVIPELVSLEDNDMLTRLPTREEVKGAVFSLNASSAPGPDGFGGAFYHAFWDVIGEDVFKSTLQFFQQNWILPGLNSNVVSLLPKFHGADRVEHFRPIALANFQFKIITKVMADRLALVASKIVSPQQRGFIRGRHISDGICIASEAFNMLEARAFGGNVAIKFDIKKAFDTLDWDFLLQVLTAFGFNDIFCSWIRSILHSAKLSFLVNGVSVGYMGCKRGVRQGDPLSPLLFCLAEEVLSRGILRLVETGGLLPMACSRSFQTPSHLLYADDILVFCRGSKSSIDNLMSLFRVYGEASGQRLSPEKCSFFTGAMRPERSLMVQSWLGFQPGEDFSYLGVPIFRGRPKLCHFQSIVDRVRLKLASWKGALLSYMGRVELVKSVISGMLLYSFQIYLWPRSLISLLERWIRNFVWSGSIDSRKLVLVNWEHACRPMKQGGLGLPSLYLLNQASLLRLSWWILHCPEQWSGFLRGRFFNGRDPVAIYRSSSILPGVRPFWEQVREQTRWVLGDGTLVSFWLDAWYGDEPLVDLVPIPPSLEDSLHASVADFVEGDFRARLDVLAESSSLLQRVLACLSRVGLGVDQPVWCGARDGVLSLVVAKDFLRPPGTPTPWATIIWQSFIPPSRSFTFWRLMLRRLPTDDNLSRRGWSLVSRCELCQSQVETSDHVFLHCGIAKACWAWFQQTFGVVVGTSNILEVFQVLERSWSPHMRAVVVAAIISIVWAIWRGRNGRRFRGFSFSADMAISLVITATRMAGNLSKARMGHDVREFMIFKQLGIDIRLPKAPVIQRVLWLPPRSGVIKCNTDGAARGCPGPAGSGGIFRDSEGQFLGAFAAYCEVTYALDAELMAAMLAVEEAHRRSWSRLWIESDSQLVVLAFRDSSLVPWKLRGRWRACLRLCSAMEFRVSHILREGNGCADQLANHAVATFCSFTWWEVAPPCISDSLFRNRSGLPEFRFRR